MPKLDQPSKRRATVRISSPYARMRDPWNGGVRSLRSLRWISPSVARSERAPITALMAPLAPIMGVGYSKAISQWSKGE